ncbi:adenosine deaminase [Aaosphaeria arxii CBS 175.79]|uniref:Adenine deaminase n=1 Tax=Aaosphaeria arxii CBS 175.79 TaxID=1450172 RepID=A0A6A5XCZ3_9PLEO|nr:adenosine deaminase [Aaosphaeria arxii CBS 175.79]KAF2010848.1 adenosine deaminase [Aaosphaeria arxii CBS 175.79]
MCKSSIHTLLKQLPKCEHHIHLEGALSPQLLFQLAEKNTITLPQDDEAFKTPESLLERYERFTSLDDFLGYYYIGMSALITASDFEALAWDYFQHASADGVHHAEVFFDPQAHTSRNVAYPTVIQGFQAACERAEKELGITTILTACYLRHLPPAESLEMFQSPEVQESYRNGTVKGIGLDSSEMNFPPHLFEDLYRGAKELGLRRTAHAGEEGPVSYISSALTILNAERIDHGIQLAQDDVLLKQIADQGTLLTVCPLSNVVLRCVKSVSEVPIRKFLDHGVKFSLNSDDPAYFGGHILDNYCAVHDAFELSVSEWESVCRAGIEGSWCSEERKTEMLVVLEKVIREWEESQN